MFWDAPVPKCSMLVYDPFKRYEAWRFVTYMFTHIGILNYFMNMILEISVGVFLEIEEQKGCRVKGSLKIFSIYMAGVLAGSLGTSMVDPDTYLAGRELNIQLILKNYNVNVRLLFDFVIH